MTFSNAIELFGIMVFAISGALAASDKKTHHNDLFSVFFTGFLTAIGGGTLRDITLGNYPVAWVRDSNVLWSILAGFLLTVALAKYLIQFRRTLFLFDTIGTGIFTVIGTRISLSYGVNPFAAVILGMVSAVFGGVIRDTLINEIPVIFRKEIYATACIAGAILYIFLDFLDINREWNTVISASAIIAIRVVVVKYNLSLPQFKIPE
ncbi:hypothetical protein CH373_06980 [Leptospira perolatii]|uniref:Glycine transporter domain-containing protein n=1 Tax=Leptospira perolatii TaxID=2023191 RepID=A0A2M9ZPG4_9LEPT|nr:trimeric intracellular cation channel family protein [Leptospira perolatii]PJZ70670.1 hypothetical protein CH360_03840 [Leptospira perolatii]PJZ73881.1 hypothetical protein CH373_06980 [Leptospira perolatii]